MQRDLLTTLLEPIIEKRKVGQCCYGSLKRASLANPLNGTFVSFSGPSFVYIVTTHRNSFKVGSKWKRKTSRVFSKCLFCRLWLLQVFTVLCLLFENSKFIENLVMKDSISSSPSSSYPAATAAPTSSNSAPLIQVISEESSQEPDSSLWSLPSLDSLCDLHPLLHSVLSSHSSGFPLTRSFPKECNQRWLLPCYNAQILIFQQYLRSSRSITRAVLEEMEFLFSCYQQIASAGSNEMLGTLSVLVTHTHSFYFSILSSLSEQQNVLEVQRSRLERDGQNSDEVRRAINELAAKCQSVARLCGSDFEMMLGELKTRGGPLPTSEIDSLLNGLASTAYCRDDKEKSAFYSLLRLLVLRLLRLNQDQLQRYVQTADQSLLSVCMNATRAFSKASHNPRDQNASLYGDLPAIVSSIAQTAILHSEAAGRVSQFAQELVDFLDKEDAGMSREVIVETAVDFNVDRFAIGVLEEAANQHRAGIASAMLAGERDGNHRRLSPVLRKARDE